MQLDQKLAIIVEMTKLLRKEETGPLDIFHEFNSIASDVTGSQRSSLYLSDKDNKTLITKVAQGINETIETAFGIGIAGQCAQLKESIIENNAQQNPYFNNNIDMQTGFTTIKSLAVPILSKNKSVLGVIQVLNKINGDYTKDDKDLLTIIAELIVSVIENQNQKSSLQDEVDKKTYELQKLNNDLSKKVELQVEKNRKQDAILFHQSKLASLGEMIDAVAHQWRQPLSVISLYMMEMQLLDEDQLSVDLIATNTDKVNQQIKHLNATLSDFRSFFRNNQEVKPFSVQKSIHSVLQLIQNDIQRYHLKITSDISDSVMLKGIENEFKHVIINLINNAKDAFEENKIEDRDIVIKVTNRDDKYHIALSDNAGGVPATILNQIFDANITSKEEGKGTGIGLYMSKMIVEKMKGTIDVAVKDKGSTFTLSFPQSY